MFNLNSILMLYRVCLFLIFIACSCGKCQSRFCWMCLQDWELHHDNKGNFFQCNRFIAPELAAKIEYSVAEQVAASANGVDPRHAHGEEKGESAIGEHQKRTAAAKSAIFLHYYSR